MKRLGKIVLLVIVAAFAAIQFVPVDRSNPESQGALQAPPDVDAVLRQSCYDCHSSETVWPWYSYVAPVSWRVAHHVEEGREHFNFSDWDTYSADDQEHIIEESIEEVEKGKMPLKDYLFVHRSANMTKADLNTLKRWYKLQYGKEPPSHDHEHDHGHDEH